MDADADLLRQVIGLGGGEPRSTEYTGTKALMVAVLESGISDYCGAEGRQCTAAECWVRSDNRGPFSFDIVCEMLGLEPSAVRQALVRLKNQSARPRRHSRPYVLDGGLTASSRTSKRSLPEAAPRRRLEPGVPPPRREARPPMQHVERLQQAIRDQHGLDSEHVASVPVTETLQGKTVWQGTVDVFRVSGDAQAHYAYAWSYETEAGEVQHVAALGVPPIYSAQDAVKAAVMAQIEKLSR